MKKILSVLSVMLILASCGGGYNPPYDPGVGNDNNSGSGSVSSPVASFEYEIDHPLTVYFYNTSKKADSYSWDFGDGTKSKEKEPVHKYKTKGVYRVVMTAYRGSKSSQCYANITVQNPTKCYVTGIVYENVPYNNEYYNIRFTDDYIFFETLYWSTSWIMLSSANIPYKYMLSSKKQIDLSESKYVLRLYENSSTSGGGSQVAKWNILTSDLKSKYPSKVTKTSGDASVTMLLDWSN